MNGIAELQSFNGGRTNVEELDDGLITIHGVALGEGDVTLGSGSGQRKRWPKEALKPSAELLEGQDIVINHENRDVRAVIGQITKSGYIDGIGVVYEGEINDEEIAEKIEYGWLEVSPRVRHTENGQDENGITEVDSIIEWDNLSVVRKGAAPSNDVEIGEHDELSLNMKQRILEELEDDEWRVGDYVMWGSQGDRMARGRIIDWTDDGTYDSEIDGDVSVEGTEDDPAALINIYREDEDGTWVETDTTVAHKFSTLQEWNPSDVEENSFSELQISQARTPTFDGTETQSWGDIPADTLSYWVDALDFGDVSSVADLTQEQKNEIAQHTLLGNPEADNLRDLLMFPVVNANTGNLNRGALEAVRGGRGQSADIPQDVYESAYRVAGRLLNDEFDADVDEEMSYASLQRSLFDEELDVDEDELDEVYQEWDDVTNMTASELRRWSGNPCSREASLDAVSVIERNLNLLETPKSEWGESEIEDAKRTISFISRMNTDEQRPESPSDGAHGCPTDWAISLLNWAHNPFDSLPEHPDDLDDVEQLGNENMVKIESLEVDQREIAAGLADIWGMSTGEASALIDALNPDEPKDRRAIATVVAREYEGLDPVDIMSLLAEAEEGGSENASYDENEVHEDEEYAKYLAEHTEMTYEECMSVLDALRKNTDKNYEGARLAVECSLGVDEHTAKQAIHMCDEEYSYDEMSEGSVLKQIL